MNHIQKKAIFLEMKIDLLSKFGISHRPNWAIKYN